MQNLEKVEFPSLPLSHLLFLPDYSSSSASSSLTRTAAFSTEKMYDLLPYTRHWAELPSRICHFWALIFKSSSPTCLGWNCFKDEVFLSRVVQLILEWLQFELCESTYTQIFFSTNTVRPSYSVVSYQQIQPPANWKQSLSLSQLQIPSHRRKVLFSIHSCLNPRMQSTN